MSPMTATTAHPLLRSVALFILLVLPSVASAQIPRFDALYVFGDSLADSGNILIQTDAMRMTPPVPPSTTPFRMYFEGRFSNGFVGFEYLWQRLSDTELGSSRGLLPFLAAPWIQAPGAINFAFGGTGTPYLDKTPGGFVSPGLKGQVELFRLALHGRKPSDRALYAIATGANDYRDDAYNVPMTPINVVRNIEDSIVSLYRLGARDILVLDLPDLGKVPVSSQDPVASKTATRISADHNKRLYSMLTRVESKHPDLRLIPIRLAPLFDRLEAGGMNTQVPLVAPYFPAAPYMAACLFIDPALCRDAPDFLFNANFGFLFWDVVHPTTEAHLHLADEMYDQLAAEYE
jgi:phospholipase/lecithinase/hemolysin